jgi:hypothetical protein
MKTIEVTDEMYDSLMELSKELNTQDHRCTAMPYFFQIQTEEWEPAPEGQGEEVWFCDGSFLESEDEVKKAVINYKEWNYEYGQNDIERKYNELTDDEKEEILENNYQKVNRQKVFKLQNAFLTEKACKDHIKKNRYHYEKPTDYLSHANRNSDMETIMKFICELSGGKMHK